MPKSPMYWRAFREKLTCRDSFRKWQCSMRASDAWIPACFDNKNINNVLPLADDDDFRNIIITLMYEGEENNNYVGF